MEHTEQEFVAVFAASPLTQRVCAIRMQPEPCVFGINTVSEESSATFSQQSAHGSHVCVFFASR